MMIGDGISDLKAIKENSGLFYVAFIKTPAWELPDYDHVESYRKKQDIRKSLYEKYYLQGRILIL